MKSDCVLAQLLGANDYARVLMSSILCVVCFYCVFMCLPLLSEKIKISNPKFGASVKCQVRGLYLLDIGAPLHRSKNVISHQNVLRP